MIGILEWSFGKYFTVCEISLAPNGKMSAIDDFVIFALDIVFVELAYRMHSHRT